SALPRKAVQNLVVTVSGSIPAKDIPHNFRFLLVDGIYPILNIVSQRSMAAVIQSFLCPLHHTGHGLFSRVQDHVLPQSGGNQLCEETAGVCAIAQLLGGGDHLDSCCPHGFAEAEPVHYITASS